MNTDYGIIHYFYKQFGKLNPKKFIIILVFIIFSSWLADGLYQLILFILSIFKIENILFFNKLIFIQFVVPLGFFIWLYFKIKENLDKLDKIKYTVKKVVPKDLKAIIIFLSKPNFNLDLLKNINSINDFKKEEIKNKKINWEVPAIVIYKILNELKKDIKIIYVILSYESKEYFIDFKDFIKRILELKEIEILANENPIDFENLETTIDTIDKAYELLNHKGLKNNQILIDITGGQKIQSTAGGFYASSYDRYFCYLSTNTKELHIFDVTHYFE
ncbi:MAG: hypothetical protein ACPL1F_05880 [bacterium]